MYRTTLSDQLFRQLSKRLTHSLGLLMHYVPIGGIVGQWRKAAIRMQRVTDLVHMPHDPPHAVHERLGVSNLGPKDRCTRNQNKLNMKLVPANPSLLPRR